MTIGVDDFGALDDGTHKTLNALAPRVDGKAKAAGVDPRVTAAVESTDREGKSRRAAVEEQTKKTGAFSRGMKSIDDAGAGKVKAVGAGKPDMPRMPPVPPAASMPATAPAPAMAAPAMAGAPPPAPAMSMPAAPSGLAGIDPQVLQQLAALSQEMALRDASEGLYPELDGDPWSGSSATTPQPGQPLDVSQVSLERYPGGVLSKEETAAVIDQALTINGVPNDPHLRAQWHELYQHMAQGESSRNPNAANNWDSNATGPIAEDGAHSNSSRGMWQTIPATFAAYHMAGTSTSIYDPVASAAASINYVMHRYHVSPEGANLASFAARRGVGTSGYTGY